MEETSARKCENCGGTLQAVDAATLKCLYCGCTYSLETRERPAASGDGRQANSVPRVNPAGFAGSGGNGSRGNGNGAKLLFFFLVVVAIVFFVVIVNVGRSGRSANSYADSLSGDTALAAMKILSDDEQQEAREPHIKKTNPDPEIVITKHRVGMDEGYKTIWIAYRNKSKHEIKYAEFNVQLFDRQGREIALPDSEKTERIYPGTEPGESSGNNWALGTGQQKAKTAKVTLKKVALDSVVWDY